MTKASTAAAPYSPSKSLPAVAVSATSRAPSACTRISWTALSAGAATMAYVALPIATISTSSMLPSAKPLSPSVAEPASSRTPLGWMRIIWTALSFCAATMAYFDPPTSNAATSLAPSRLAKSGPSVAESIAASVGLPATPGPASCASASPARASAATETAAAAATASATAAARGGLHARVRPVLPADNVDGG